METMKPGCFYRFRLAGRNEYVDGVFFDGLYYLGDDVVGCVAAYGRLHFRRLRQVDAPPIPAFIAGNVEGVRLTLNSGEICELIEVTGISMPRRDNYFWLPRQQRLPHWKPSHRLENKRTH
jgi:hypothetical protein